MANFGAVLDPDPERRARFLDRARASVDVRDGLSVGEVAMGSFAVLWAAASTVPVDLHRDATGTAVVWGDALLPSASRPMRAADILRSWGGETPDSPAADGFHAALAFSASGALVAGCDLLGLFPVYHWSGPEGVVIVASSPELLQCHPSFRPVLSLHGLAGVLLTGGSVGGRTLWKDVRRLAPGHLLRVRPGRRPEEVLQYTLPVGDSSSLRREDAPEALHEALGHAVERVTQPGRRHALLLSGGRDSRLLAGYLRQLGVPFRAQTLGRSSDHEARCARGVVRALGMRRALSEVPLGRFAEYARLHARVEHLMGNASGLYTWGIGDVLDPADDAVVAGHDLELACGGVHLAWSGGQESGGPSWEGLRRTVAEHAFQLDVLDRLVRDTELREAIHETEGVLEARFVQHGEDPEARARGFIWEHWARHHAGAFPWRLSFTAWPALPVLDQELLAVGARIPARAAAGRAVQDEILRRHHKRLARIPLVRPSGSHEPVDPGPGWTVRRAAGRAGAEVAARIPGVGRKPLERRYYRRTYDLDNDGWMGVRQAAEPFRDRLHELFHANALHDLVPAPDRAMRLARPIADGYGRKTLLGLMLWAGR